MLKPSREPGVAVVFHMFKDLSESEFQQYEKAVRALRHAMEGDLTVYVLDALQSLQELVQQIRRLVEHNSAAAVVASSKEWRTSLTCAVLTYCAAFHLFQEQTEAAVTRSFGAQTTEVARIKAMFSEVYDRCLEYRVMYRLRNVLVHYSLGAVGCEFKQSEETSPQGLILHTSTVRVTLNRARFLSSKRGVSSEMRTALLALPADPDLLRYAVVAVGALMEMHRKAFDLIHPELGSTAQTVRELARRYPDEQGTPGLASFPYRQKGYPTSFSHTLIEPDVFDYAKQLATTEVALPAPTSRPGRGAKRRS